MSYISHKIIHTIYLTTFQHNLFFSSRRRHTSSLCDWSSDVCSSDLNDLTLWLAGPQGSAARPMPDGRRPEPGGLNRSEERRVGKEGWFLCWDVGYRYIASSVGLEGVRSSREAGFNVLYHNTLS